MSGAHAETLCRQPCSANRCAKTGNPRRLNGGAVTAWLASNCFGDYYTRGGLDIRMRELITFCFLAAQGGCEAQLTSHAAGNMAVGNGAQFLVSAVHHILPYIGYPRSLNALACIDAARKK